MLSAKPNVLRIIAEHELDACFSDLSRTTRNELATSLVRQWITTNGSAVRITRDYHFWFRMTHLEAGQRQVVRTVQKGTFSEFLRRSRVIEEQILALLHELSLCQSARCYTDYGKLLQLRVDPAQERFYIELVPDQER
jgi:hypothetical protein